MISGLNYFNGFMQFGFLNASLLRGRPYGAKMMAIEGGFFGQRIPTMG